MSETLEQRIRRMAMVGEKVIPVVPENVVRIFDGQAARIAELEAQLAARPATDVAALVQALEPLANLDITQTLNAKPDDYPVFGLNGSMITVGDIKRAVVALAGRT